MYFMSYTVCIKTKYAYIKSNAVIGFPKNPKDIGRQSPKGSFIIVLIKKLCYAIIVMKIKKFGR